MSTTSSEHPVLSQIEFEDKPEGPVSAAILAAGVGSLALGIFTTLSEATETFHDFFEWSARVGPLSGKTVCAVIVWLVSWAVLYAVLRDKPYETRRAMAISMVLVGLGLVGTFPTFFQAFA
ncbi:MAG TPA: hypothetical protein VFW06_02380 [Acidimicrobiia bacterium]|nr:hypothetical protein [Acidimicrobiia bacterium]